MLSVLNEYRAPTEENVAFLIDGGLRGLRSIRDYAVTRYEAPDPDEKPSEEEVLQRVNKEYSVNEFYRMMQVIHGKTNTEALAQGFLRLLSNYVESKNTYLPQSVIEISFFEDLLIVFWRLLHSNPNFLEEVV